MPDERTAQRPVQAEVGHQVDGGEDRGRGLLSAVGGVEAEVGHEVREEPGVDVDGGDVTGDVVSGRHG